MRDPSLTSVPSLGATPPQWFRLIASLAIVFALFHGLATALGSDRGQAGLSVAAAVEAALLAVEWVLFQQAPAKALQSLGFGQPAVRGLVVALGVCVALIAVIAVYAHTRDVYLTLYPGWLWLLPG